jgi:hypothetical protein
VGLSHCSVGIIGSNYSSLAIHWWRAWDWRRARRLVTFGS